MNYSFEDLLLSNTLNSLEVNVILQIMMKTLGNMMIGLMKVSSYDMPQILKGTLVIIRGCTKWLTILTLKSMKEFL